MTDLLWRLVFATSIQALILGVLLTQGANVPGWFLAVYPAAGAILAMMASRTPPEPAEASNRQSASAGVAAFVLTVALVNVLLIDFLTRHAMSHVFETENRMAQIGFLIFQAAALCLWFALTQRRRRARQISSLREETHRFYGRRSDPITGLNAM